MSYLIAILTLGLVCGLWVLFQGWMAKQMPEAPGISRKCGNCTNDGACRDRGDGGGGSCDAQH